MLAGVLVESLDTQVGTWQYTLDAGRSWRVIRTDLINRDGRRGLVLSLDARLRVLPFGGQRGSARVAFHPVQFFQEDCNGIYRAYAPADERPPVALTGHLHEATPWPRHRLAQPFEDLRANAGDTTVFLANLGPIAAHTARATFAANLFAAGGIRAVSDDGHKDAESAAAAFQASGADLVCICSSDDVYADLAEATAAALKATGATRVYLAGKGDFPSVDEYIHVGVDTLDVLTRAEAAR